METPKDALLTKIENADAGDLAQAAPGSSSAAPTMPAGGPLIVDESQLWIEAATRYGAVVRTMLPERARPHWTDARLGELGRELANCAKVYGWKFGGMVNHPLVRLATVAMPLAWPLVEPVLMPYIKAAFKKAGVDLVGVDFNGGGPASPAPASSPAVDPLAVSGDAGSRAPTTPGEQLH